MTFEIRFATLRPKVDPSGVFVALAVEPLYSNSPNELGQVKARKALAAALRAKTPRRWKAPKLNPGVALVSLPRPQKSSGHWWTVNAGGLGDAQAEAYAEAMGRPWSEVDPEPRREAFGCPDSPSYPLQPDTARMTRAEIKRARDEYRTASDAAHEAYTVWRPLYDAWRETPDYTAYLAACHRWQARRDQFAYTGRGRDAEQVRESVTFETMVLEGVA